MDKLFPTQGKKCNPLLLINRHFLPSHMISVAAVVCADGPAVKHVYELHPETGADSPLSLVGSPPEALPSAKPGPAPHTG